MARRTTKAPTQASFGERLRAYRGQGDLTQEELAKRLGITRATVARWENGTARPGAASIPLLVAIGAPTPEAHETNALTIPRLKTGAGTDKDRAAQLRAASERGFRLGTHEGQCTPAPYVRNGPPDQAQFHDLLISMQEQHTPVDDPVVYRRRLALVEEADGVTTAQHQLERRRPTALSWNSNYGPHGWHRYVGRFPPHLVRALLNAWRVTSGDVVLDPFAGSGTTLVEARLLGLDAIGVELCPLSAMISRVKSQFPINDPVLSSLADDLLGQCANHSSPDTVDEMFARYPKLLPFPNADKWFTPQALGGVGAVIEFADELDGYRKEFVLTALSSKMRSIGNVDVDVVRAEYRHEPRRDVDVPRLVAQQLRKMVSDIGTTAKTHDGLLGSAASVSVLHESVLTATLPEASVKAIVTSPPYGVESLSYLRTHLLSYRTLNYFLGADPYERQAEVIGSEYLDGDGIEPSTSPAWEASPSYRSFFSQPVGRKDERRSLMMAKFFHDILVVAERCRHWLSTDGHMAFVIGNKRLGDRIIPTHEIVSELFAQRGLHEEHVIAHKLKTNNSNSQVPWQERIIQDEFVMIFRTA